jgi:hypothetical protein
MLLIFLNGCTVAQIAAKVSARFSATLLRRRTGARLRLGPPNDSCGDRFDDGDFVVGEAVEFIDESARFAVGGFDLTLDDGTLVGGFGFGKALASIFFVAACRASRSIGFLDASGTRQ